MQLCRLVYFSRNVLASHGEALRLDLKQILSTAVTQNVKRGITGGLLFNRLHFVQVLEGDRVALTETFLRISRDRRHQDIVLNEMTSVSQRLFGNWSMGYAQVGEHSDAARRIYGLGPSFDPQHMSADELVAKVLEEVSQGEAVIHSAGV